jgi:chaperone LolA
MKYPKIILILLISITSLSIANTLVSKVKAKFTDISTIQGNFNQTICTEITGTCQQFEGKFSIARPYFSRLEVAKPEKQLIISDSLNLYFYLVNKKKVYIQSANSGINFFKVFDVFLNDTASFITTYQDSNYTVLTHEKDTLNPNNIFEDLTLHINNKTNMIEQFSYTDMNGSEIKFELTDISVNPKLSGKLFKFEIPKGVEKIKY